MAWSDAARVAAAETRRRNKHKNTALHLLKRKGLSGGGSGSTEAAKHGGLPKKYWYTYRDKQNYSTRAPRGMGGRGAPDTADLARFNKARGFKR